MTVLRLYSVRDVVADVYGRPFASTNDGTALRSIQAEVSTPGNMLASNPGDFELYYVGDFNDYDGSFVLQDRPKLLVRLSALLTDAISAANRAGTLEESRNA